MGMNSLGFDADIAASLWAAIGGISTDPEAVTEKFLRNDKPTVIMTDEEAEQRIINLGTNLNPETLAEILLAKVQ